MRALLLAAGLLLAGCSTPDPQAPSVPTPATQDGAPPQESREEAPRLRLVPVFERLAAPVLVLEVPDGSGDLVVVLQEGLVVRGPGANATTLPFLDLRDRVRAGGERGLLGVAFVPGQAGRVAIASYTDLEGHSVLSRLRLAGDAPDPSTEEVLLRVEQPFPNHNGGNVVYGPDGYLYFGLGDGGSGGDPQGNGQDKDALLGSLLRLDVGAQGPYRVPPDNPFVGRAGADEVWAKGLRNPWRFSFDRETGDLWIGDVGQNSVEEIDLQPASSRGGENYGWNVWEGHERYRETARTEEAPVAPVHTYPTDDGCAVTGGHVYRGPSAPSLVGTYVFGDYCNGNVYGLRHDGATWTSRVLLETEHSISSFGEDLDGDVYVVDIQGSVLRLVEE